MCLAASAHPAHRLPYRIGMLCLAMSLLPQLLHSRFGLASGPVDLLRGLLLGMALVFLYAAAAARRQPPTR
jgi:hypothetical protein